LSGSGNSSTERKEISTKKLGGKIGTRGVGKHRHRFLRERCFDLKVEEETIKAELPNLKAGSLSKDY